MYPESGNDFATGYAVGRDSNGSNGGFGFGNGDGAWWIIILLIFGWGGGRGFGGGYGGGCGSSCATQADLAAGFNNSAVLSSLNDLKLGQAGVQQTLCQGFNGVNTTVLQGFNGVDNAICTLGYNMAQSINGVSSQIAGCCCETQRAIERGFADTNYNLATQSCEIKNTLNTNTRDIIDAQNAGTQAILGFLTQSKIDDLQSKLATAENQLSQARQTQAIVDQVRPCPIPAYITCNPYAYQYQGCGNSCGCGC